MEDYKKKYEEVLAKAKAIHNLASETSHENTRMAIEELFPELKESEDKKIRKSLIGHLKECRNNTCSEVMIGTYANWIAWLEKQGEPQVRTGIEWVNTIDDACDKRYSEEYAHGEYCHEQSFKWGFQEGVDWLEKQGKKIDVIENFDTEFEKQVSHLIASIINKEYEYTSDFVKWTANTLLNYAKNELEKQVDKKKVDNVKSKFNVGDWIVYCNETVVLITGIKSDGYIINKSGYIPFTCQGNMRLWTIQDAKNGDVLVASDGSIFIFKEIEDCGCKHYIALEKDSKTINMNDNLEHFWESIRGVKPATKEQCDLLFSKMKGAGYEWDAEKKELKKIKQKSVELSEICNYLECQKREESSRKNILNKWIVFLKSLNIEEAATKGAMVQINRVLNVLDWAEKKGSLSHSDWEDCYTIIASLKYRLKK